MSESEIKSLDNPTVYKKRTTACDDYVCIIYKMIKDKIQPDVIFSYCIKSGYKGSFSALDNQITNLHKNNFNIVLRQGYYKDFKYSDDITIIKRNELLKYITIKNDKIKKDETISLYLDIIKKKYPVVMELEKTYDSFYSIIMGEDPDQLDGFINAYEETVVKSFVNGIKKDIAPVKNAISLETSSGFVEGNNNKFKLLKRILYGRSNLVNLFKKCYLPFMMDNKDFDIRSLIIPPKNSTTSRAVQ